MVLQLYFTKKSPSTITSVILATKFFWWSLHQVLINQLLTSWYRVWSFLYLLEISIFPSSMSHHYISQLIFKQVYFLYLHIIHLTHYIAWLLATTLLWFFSIIMICIGFQLLKSHLLIYSVSVHTGKSKRTIWKTRFSNTWILESKLR